MDFDAVGIGSTPLLSVAGCAPKSGMKVRQAPNRFDPDGETRLGPTLVARAPVPDRTMEKPPADRCVKGVSIHLL